MMNSAYFARLRTNLLRTGIPATWCLIAVSFTLFLLPYIIPAIGDFLDRWVWFDSASWWPRVWTLVTGSLQAGSLISALFASIWLYFVGGSLERSFGTRTFLGLCAGLSAIIGLGLILGYYALHEPRPLMLFALVDALTVIWGLLNRRVVIYLWCVLPISGILLACLSPIFTLVYYGPQIGLFALTGCAAAWGYYEYRRRRQRWQGVTRIGSRRPIGDDGELSPLARLRTWQQRRRLERLLGDSDREGRDSEGQRWIH